MAVLPWQPQQTKILLEGLLLGKKTDEQVSEGLLNSHGFCNVMRRCDCCCWVCFINDLIFWCDAAQFQEQLNVVSMPLVNNRQSLAASVTELTLLVIHQRVC